MVVVVVDLTFPLLEQKYLHHNGTVRCREFIHLHQTTQDPARDLLQIFYAATGIGHEIHAIVQYQSFRFEATKSFADSCATSCVESGRLRVNSFKKYFQCIRHVMLVFSASHNT